MSAGEISPEWEAAGLFDPTAPNADGRRDLLVFFEEVGYSPGDFTGLSADDHLSAIASRRENRPGRRLRRADAIALSGLPPDTFNQAARAGGYSNHEDAEFTDDDIRGFQLFEQATAFFSRTEMQHFSSVMSSALGRIAEAASALFRLDISTQIEAGGGAEAEYARKNHEAAQLLAEVRGPMWAIFLSQLEQATTRADLARLAVEDGVSMSTVRMGVGFVDLVGYTELSARLSPDELSNFLRRFEEDAYAGVADFGGRVVKLIGDEVMFVTVDPNDAVSAAHTLQETFRDEGVVPRAGVGYGDLVARGGDYYGSVVNLAARIADCAIPGELLVDAATADVADQHVFEPAGQRMLKGFATPQRLAALVPPST